MEVDRKKRVGEVEEGRERERVRDREGGRQCMIERFREKVINERKREK